MNNSKNLEDYKRIDLHVHTCASDGEQSVETVIREAEAAGITVLAITDHNSFTLTNPRSFKGMHVVPGIEFSAEYKVPDWGQEAIEVHIVGLFPNGVNPAAFADVLSYAKEGRENYICAILQSLEDRGIHITLDEVKEMRADGDYLSRQEIAKVLVQKGIETNIESAFDNQIGNMSAYYVPSTRYLHYASMQEIVEMIVAEGGIGLLAHPYMYSMNDEEMERLISDFKDAAGSVGGIEVYYEAYLEKPERMIFLKNMAKKYNLLASAGSDRHRADQHFCTAGDMRLFTKMINALQEHNTEMDNVDIQPIDFEMVIRYRCKWCGKDTLRTPKLHSCRFDPKKRNCLSCKSCGGVELIRLSDGAVISNQEAEIFDYEKRFICRKGCDGDGDEGIRTIWKLSQLKRWDAECPAYEKIPGYKGKDSYLTEVVYKNHTNRTVNNPLELQFSGE